jgi:hypothetical protein
MFDQPGIQTLLPFEEGTYRWVSAEISMTEVYMCFPGPISVGILEFDGKPRDYSWQI